MWKVYLILLGFCLFYSRAQTPDPNTNVTDISTEIVVTTLGVPNQTTVTNIQPSATLPQTPASSPSPQTSEPATSTTDSPTIVTSTEPPQTTTTPATTSIQPTVTRSPTLQPTPPIPTGTAAPSTPQPTPPIPTGTAAPSTPQPTPPIPTSTAAPSTPQPTPPIPTPSAPGTGATDGSTAIAVPTPSTTFPTPSLPPPTHTQNTAEPPTPTASESTSGTYPVPTKTSTSVTNNTTPDANSGTTNVEASTNDVPVTTPTVPPGQAEGALELILAGISNSEFKEQEFKDVIAKYAKQFCQAQKDKCKSENIRADDVIIAEQKANGSSLVLTIYISGGSPSTAALTSEQLQAMVQEQSQNLKNDLGYDISVFNKMGTSAVIEDWLIAVLAALGFLLVMAITYASCHVIQKKRKNKKRMVYETEISLHRNESDVGKLEMQANDDVHHIDESQFTKSTDKTDTSNEQTNLIKDSETTTLTSENETASSPESNGTSVKERSRMDSTAEYQNTVEKEFNDIVEKAGGDTSKLIEEPESEKKDNAFDNPALNVGDEKTTNL